MRQCRGLCVLFEQKHGFQPGEKEREKKKKIKKKKINKKKKKKKKEERKRKEKGVRERKKERKVFVIFFFCERKEEPTSVSWRVLPSCINLSVNSAT